MKDHTVQLIGAGVQTRNNILPSLLLCGAQITSITTRSMEHSNAASAAYGLNAHAYADMDAMLKQESGDKVVIVMQAKDAVPAVLKCLHAGKQVFVEKPCGMNLNEASEIYKASQTSGKGVMVGFMKRFAPVYCRLKETIFSHQLGPVRSFHVAFNVDASRFCKDDADYVYFVAIHMLDLIRFLFGEVSDIQAVRNDEGNGCSYAASFQMGSGAVGTVCFENRTAWTRESESVQVTMENGFAATQELNRLTIHPSRSIEAPWQTLSENDQVFSDCFNPASGTTKDLWLRGFAGEMKAFCENDVLISDDNVRTTKLCEDFLLALHKSAHSCDLGR
jgi:UDP-N-acetylglucosamine 3-dehydrogenase